MILLILLFSHLGSCHIVTLHLNSNISLIHMDKPLNPYNTIICSWLLKLNSFGLWMFFVSVILMTCIFLQLINNMKRDASRLSSSYSSSNSRVSAHSNPSKKSSSSSQAYYLWLLRAVVNYLIKMSCCSVNLIYDLILLSLSLILLFWTIIGTSMKSNCNCYFF
jgi:hypothetical protein